MRIKPHTILGLFLLITILTSCSLERKIAKNYVKAKEKKSVLVFFPTELFKTNLKTYQALADDSLRMLNHDSFLMDSSLFLKYINDSLFLAKCWQSMVNELVAHGFMVYSSDQIDEFMDRNDSSYVINLAQMQLEEYVHTEMVEAEIDGRYYSGDVDLNAVNLNSWFELERNQIPNEKYPVLYSSYFIYDDLQGEFRQSNSIGEVNYRYKLDTMQVADVYNLAELAGKKYAINFYDYLLNIYVQDHLPKNQGPVFYFHYDRRMKSLQTYYYDGFTEIDPKN
ncbi:MAG: hypothetical protein CVU00_07835 [Bacteroidetes bacterium HGW-Bacteroidetes-17]|jgi:hypothetical protein|nr:MAG: hypothetical protein CVU00_07835 [Bacteroidetes bacterium HGW-Bacteroidetes-17]